MDDREFYLQRHKAEQPAFLKVLKALPKDKLDYKPHERGPSAEQLMWTLAAELKACVEMVDEGKTEWKNIPPPPYDEMVAKYEEWSNELAGKVEKMDDAAWNRKAQFLYEGKVVFEQEAGKFIWFILFDSIHHRGQLSAYLRPMGGKVPAIYGPSADESSAE